MELEFQKLLHDDNKNPRLSKKVSLWLVFLISVEIFFNNLASSSALEDQNGKNELHEFFLMINKTALDFHNLIEKLDLTNNKKLLTTANENGETFLHKAVQLFPVLNQTLDILKANRLDFNILDNGGNSAFFKAVQYGRNELFLSTLISYGMDWKTMNKNNESALHVAALHANLPAVNLLILLGSEVNARASDGRTPLHQALNSTNVSLNTFDLVSKLVSSDADLKIVDGHGNSVLAGNNHLEGYFVQIIHFLIENNANVNAVDKRGNTFLHVLALTGTPVVFHDTVEYLNSTNNTNSLNITNINGQTVLHNAVEKMEVCNETLEIFQRSGIDYNALNYRRESILFVASSHRRASFLKNLIAFGADWRRTDGSRSTPLHSAAGWGNLDAVKLFIQLGTDVNAFNGDGMTALHSAFSPYYDVVTKLELVTELINHGANGNIQDESSDFPVDMAQRRAEKGKVEDGIMQLLQGMPNRPTFNNVDDSDFASNKSVRLTKILDELEQLNFNSTKTERIFEIVHIENLVTIKGVLDHLGKSINVTEIWDQARHSLLHVAIKYRDFSVVEYFVNRQGFASKLNDTSLNAYLVQTCMENINRVSPESFKQKLAILQLLFDIQPELIESKFINENLENSWFFRGRALHYSIETEFTNGKQLELIKMLIDNKANVNAKKGLSTALHLAVERNHLAVDFLQIIRQLIENHADANVFDVWGCTFLHDIGMKSTPTVLHEVVAYLDSINNTKSFTLETDFWEVTPLHFAVHNMEVQNETLEIFQRRLVDFNALDKMNSSVLSYASKGGRSDAYLKSLIAFGADWRKRDRGQTKFQFAVDIGNLDLVRLYLQLGAEVNDVNRYGLTSLHYAFSPHHDGVTKLDLVTELLNHGANGNIQSESGDFPIDMARRKMQNGTLEDGIMQLLENMKTRPSFNQLEASENEFNSSVKFTKLLGGLEQLKINSTETAEIYRILRSENLETINGVLGHVGQRRDVTDIWDEQLRSLLHVAINYRDYSVVEHLIYSQGFVKKLNDTEFSEDLVELCLKNINTVSSASFEHKLKILQLLFDLQPDLIESKVMTLWDSCLPFDDFRAEGTPLIYSAASEFSNGKQFALLQMLIDNRANVNATTKPIRFTALHLAVEHHQSSLELIQIIRFLIENHVDVSDGGDFGNTFVQEALLKCTPAVLHEMFVYLDSLNDTDSFNIKNVYFSKDLLKMPTKRGIYSETLSILQRRGVDTTNINWSLYFNCF